MKIIGIAGGSGSGKSTISYRLVDTYPDKIGVLNLDDYQKEDDGKTELPTLHSMVNWDHPDIIRWDKLMEDLKKSERGKSINIKTWSHRSNPDYFRHRKMIPRTIYPREVLIIEGYLALWNENLRKLYKRSYYLDLVYETSFKRRHKIKFKDDIYESKILLPMRKKYVEPTKKFADLVLDVSNMREGEVYKKIEDDIKINLGFI